jgi:hypothetical protein
VVPPFRADGTLPPGIHHADWAEIASRFGGTPRRSELLIKLRRGLDNLRDAGVPWALLNGSFVTTKAEPNDVDGCWQYAPAVDVAALDPVFLISSPENRVAMKSRYGMDFFVAAFLDIGSGRPFAEVFQTGRDGSRKGIIRLDLAAERSAQT